MKNYDRLIFELSISGREGFSLPNSVINGYSIQDINQSLLRRDIPALPEVSELDVIRHYTNISHKNFGVETGFYPLGSCTMKYNPKINEEIAAMKAFNSIHPLQTASDTQGVLKIYYELQSMLSEISGLHAYTLNPFAGAQGELTGLMIMKEYHLQRGDFKRTKVIVPDSAHGTNPASATLCGFDIIEIESTPEGTVDLEQLKAVLSDEVAGMMLTNPNTLGIFEKDIVEIARLVHEAGGLMYYHPGDMGFDIMHINLHKTFSTPHGGGGPGAGPVGVKEFLTPYLPNPQIKKMDNHFFLDWNKDSIGSVSGFYGNFKVWLRAYVYIMTLGKENLKNVGVLSTLNANYVRVHLEDDFNLPIKGFSMHECVFDGLKDQSTGVTTLDVAKRLLDYGVHAPTIYFPLLFHQSIMIEPTETESKQTLDEFIAVMKKVAKEAITDPQMMKLAPHTTPISRIDEVFAAKKMILTYKDYLKENQ